MRRSNSLTTALIAAFALAATGAGCGLFRSSRDRHRRGLRCGGGEETHSARRSSAMARADRRVYRGAVSERRWRETVPRAPREGATRDVRGGSRADRVVSTDRDEGGGTPRRRRRRARRRLPRCADTAKQARGHRAQGPAQTDPGAPPARCQPTLPMPLGIFWTMASTPKATTQCRFCFRDRSVRRRRAARRAGRRRLCAGTPGVAARSVRDTRGGRLSVGGGRKRDPPEGSPLAIGRPTPRGDPETSSSNPAIDRQKGGGGALEPSKSENATLAIPVTPATPATPTPAAVGRTTHASSSSERRRDGDGRSAGRISGRGRLPGRGRLARL